MLVKNHYSLGACKGVPVKEAAQIVMQGSSLGYEGVIENLQSDLIASRDFVARFFAILYEKNILSEDDVLMILGSDWKKDE